MKKGLSLLAIFSIFSIAVWAQDAVIEPTESSYDFGQIPQGTPVKHEFTITNSGTEPLLIEKINSTCECIVVEWPKEPIKPGESSVITAKYDAANYGDFREAATIISNASNGEVQLFLEGTVLVKAVPMKDASGSGKKGN